MKYNRFNFFVDNKTAIYISHRLSSCVFCDSIAVFDKTELVGTGTHNKLVNMQGKYREFCNVQKNIIHKYFAFKSKHLYIGDILSLIHI